MRKVLLVFTVIALASTVTGCDFMRTLAGRPASDVIQAKRLVMEEAKRVEQARLDSLEAVRRHVADSLALDDSILASGIVLPMRFKTSEMRKHYCVMLATCSDKSNAARLYRKISDSGYEAVWIPFKSGATAVAACPSDGLQEVYASYLALKRLPFCPKDVCIMSRNDL